jgi:hypothetical protein
MVGESDKHRRTLKDGVYVTLTEYPAWIEELGRRIPTPRLLRQAAKEE